MVVVKLLRPVKSEEKADVELMGENWVIFSLCALHMGLVLKY